MAPLEAPTVITVQVSPYAGFTRRMGAFIVDVLLIRAITLWALNRLAISQIMIEWLVALSIYLGYFFLLTWRNQGQTLGKMMFKLQVVTKDLKALSMSDVFFREVIGRYLQKALPLLYLIPLVTRRKLGAADFIANTAVINKYH